jgi:hypothetical protein
VDAMVNLALVDKAAGRHGVAMERLAGAFERSAQRGRALQPRRPVRTFGRGEPRRPSLPPVSRARGSGARRAGA